MYLERHPGPAPGEAVLLPQVADHNAPVFSLCGKVALALCTCTTSQTSVQAACLAHSIGEMNLFLYV